MFKMIEDHQKDTVNSPSNVEKYTSSEIQQMYAKEVTLRYVRFSVVFNFCLNNLDKINIVKKYLILSSIAMSRHFVSYRAVRTFSTYGFAMYFTLHNIILAVYI